MTSDCLPHQVRSSSRWTGQPPRLCSKCDLAWRAVRSAPSQSQHARAHHGALTPTGTLGPFPVPRLGGGAGGAERIVLLDALMCVAQQAAGGSSYVWVRPSMRRKSAAEDDDDDFI